MNEHKLTPFVKWAGGKRQLLDKIKQKMPKNYRNYHEPFVGAGAVLFGLQPKCEVFINDINAQLINVYQQIKHDLDGLIRHIDAINRQPCTESHYNAIRKRYNDNILKQQFTSETAGLFLYLNKYCYNGLYRVNQKGLFNVPWNQKEQVAVYDRQNLLAIATFLENIHISNQDFETSLQTAQAKDFVFLDSPYAPLNEQSFSSYTKQGFTQADHERLAQTFKELDKKGCYIMLTNHDTPFIRKLYDGYCIETVPVKRMINQDANNRTGTEIIITNYPNEENKHMKRNFEAWLNTMTDSVATWGYYTDFEKAHANTEKIRKELSLLNRLQDSQNIKEEFLNVVAKRPETLSAIMAIIPILIAKRDKTIVIKDTEKDHRYDFSNKNLNPHECAMFLEKTGIFDLLQNKLINNIYDYVLGIEVGLDSNARKNRTGDAMEDIVERHLVQSGWLHNINYWKELNKSAIEQRWGIDLSKLETEKRFDFVVKTANKIYAIETNFYNAKGSKLNAIIESYQPIFEKTQTINNFEFIWITDGQGWKSAKNNLETVFSISDNIFNLADLNNNILNDVLT